MLSKARRDRSLPTAWLHHRNAFGEAVTEHARHLLWGYGLKLFPKQEGRAERRGVYRGVSTGQGVRDSFAVAIDGGCAPRRAQEDLAECEVIFGLEALRVGLKIGGKLRLARFRDRRIFR